MKKIFAILLSLALMLSLAVPAMADGETTYSITINNTAPDHTYEAYQIFKGDLNDSTLSNVQWGDSVASHSGDATAIVEKMDTDYTGTDKITVADLLNMITLDDEVATSGAQSEGKYVISGLTAGYYLVKDVYGSLNGKDDAYTEFIVKVVKDVEAAPKGNVPQVEKKVKDTNDTTGETTGWQDSADYDINDDVPFQLTATLANNVSAYKTYKIIFHDTLSKGLTFKEITKVTVAGKNITEGYVDNAVVNEDGTTSLTITFADIKLQGGTDSSTVVVEYTATLNTNAEIGKIGNPNYVYLEYSNNPNWDADGDGKPDEPGTPDDETPEEPTGKTPEDKVIVFTYKTIVNKVDQNNKPLGGADFKLEKFVNNAWVEVDLVKSAAGDIADAVFTATGLDDGNYRLTETQTPPGYNTIDPIEFTITADHDTAWESQAQTEVLNTVTGTNGFSVTHEKITDADGEEKDVQVVGSLSTSVVNNAGTTLPETGGMGTTIFYAVGGVMVAAAAILLVTKKRMSNNA